MTDEMYARIREVADKHGGRVDVTIAHPDLTTPVIAHPREYASGYDYIDWRAPRLPPQVYMTETDLDDFRERFRAEGLKPREPEVYMQEWPREPVFMQDEPSTADYSRYLDCVYQGRHIVVVGGACPLCGTNGRDFEAKAVWD